MDKYTHLLWTDLETTGTDEVFDPIIEIGWVLTDYHADEVINGGSRLVYSPHTGERLAINDFVRRMHEENGLTEALGDVDPADNAASVAVDLVNILRSLDVVPHKIVIAGSGVAHFDRRFIHTQMPALDKFLAYPAFDVGILRRMLGPLDLQWVYDQVSPLRPQTKAHRAYDDALDHLREFQQYRTVINEYMSPPESD